MSSSHPFPSLAGWWTGPTPTADAAGVALQVEGLSAGYLGNPVLEDLGFELPTGALVGVLGPNGAGKSTMLKAMLGLIPASSRRILFLGAPLAERRNRVAYVPQRNAVDWNFPATVLDVVLMGRYGRLPWWKLPGKADKEAALAALAQVDMEAFAQRQIGNLSGGQQQRVFLARALAQQAELYLLDEPLAGVDATSEAVIIERLREIRGRGGTVVVVHHDLGSAPRYYDHLLLLNRRVVACGPTEAVFRAETLQQAYGGRLAVLQEGEKTLLVEG